MSAHRIKAGDYQAVVVSQGAGLAQLRRGGRDLVLSHEPDETPIGFSGKVLVPWPNRIAGATYFYQGVKYTVPMNEPERNCALHGLKSSENWDVVSATESEIQLKCEVTPSSGYPFRLETTVTYALWAEAGLSIRISTVNTGEDAAPYGTGTHCYLTCDHALVDDCVLTIPAATVLEVDKNLIPTGRAEVEKAGLDFRGGRPVGATEIDHAFTDLPAALPGHQWEVILTDPDTGMSVGLASDEKWLQVFSGDNFGRTGMAVEPMTCPPNAFNSGEDLIVLDPGESSVHELRIFERH